MALTLKERNREHLKSLAVTLSFASHVLEFRPHNKGTWWNSHETPLGGPAKKHLVLNSIL